MLLQPGDQLADEMAPADAQAAGAQLPQQLYRPLGEQLVGGVVVPAVLHQHAVPDGGGPAQLLHQGLPLGDRGTDHDLHHAQLPGLLEHAADQGPGYPQLLGNVALLPVVQIVALGHIGQLLQFLLIAVHRYPRAADVTFVTLS